MASLYRTEAPGDWGEMRAPQGGVMGTARLTGANRPDIFYRYWRTNGPATLLFLHGLGAHSGWFNDFGNAVADLGVNVYAMDHQGFGRSGGPRGDIKDFHEFLTDIDRMADAITREEPGTKLFVMGHSMGGIFATYYTAAHQNKLAGVILINPWVVDTTKTSLGTLLKGLFGGITGSNAYVELPDAKGTRGMTGNPDADRLLQADQYWVVHRTQRFYWQVAFLMKGKFLQEAAKITIPALVIQGEGDTTLDQKASRAAFEKIASADKTWRTYPGVAHDFEFEPERSAIDTDVATWVKQHS